MLFLTANTAKSGRNPRCQHSFSLAARVHLDKVESVPCPRAATPGNRHMSSTNPHSQDVDELLLNARLRDELEPFLDESVHILDCRRLPTSDENEFLAQMLAWERAPVLPIARWFEPELILPPPDHLDDRELRTLLTRTIERLYSRRIILDFT